MACPSIPRSRGGNYGSNSAIMSSMWLQQSLKGRSHTAKSSPMNNAFMVDIADVSIRTLAPGEALSVEAHST
eukprot:8642845-Prorocentrum_lima.AAC.1